MDIKQQEINEIIQIIQTFNKNGLSKEKEQNKKTTRIPLILTYNRTLRNVEKIIASNWNLLQINKEFQNSINKHQSLHLKEKTLFTIY